MQLHRCTVESKALVRIVEQRGLAFRIEVTYKASRLPDMGRISTNRQVAEALLKTLRQLEADPTVDSNDPIFIQMKCILVQRLLSLELDTAELQSSIHLVEAAEPDAAVSDLYSQKETIA